jgi:C-terminal processing protease CtpA/Prc
MVPLLTGLASHALPRDGAATRSGADAAPAPTTASGPATRPAIGYAQAFGDLYLHLGRQYPAFRLKGIDWKQVGNELLPRARQVRNDREFGLLCMQLVARLEDSHAGLLAGSAAVPEPPLPRWDPGLACLIDDRERLVVYYLDPRGPWQRLGVKAGMSVVSVDGVPASTALAQVMSELKTWAGHSSERCLRYDAAHMLFRRQRRGDRIRVGLEDLGGASRTVELVAERDRTFPPRLPVPSAGIRESTDLSWKRLPDDIGYIYLRRIGPDLPGSLDRALKDLSGSSGLVLDLRGNGGGGFDGARALRNFNLDDGAEPLRPRFTGPIAMLIDERCISAGEGWASWFVARRRARLFGSATAGASSRKETYTLTNGLYRVIFPVKLYRGFLARPIELRGLEPDVPVRCRAADLAAGRDTVLAAAAKYLKQAAASEPP